MNNFCFHFTWVPMMGFCQWPEMRSKVGKSGFGGAKVGENGSKPIFQPTLDPFWDNGKNPYFSPHLKGGGNCFPKRALKQP